MASFKGSFLQNWKFFLLVGTPLLLLPLLICKDEGLIPVKKADHQGFRPVTKLKCAYVILLMAVYWTFQVLPLPVTAFLPVALLPLFGVQDTSKVSYNYMRESNMHFVGAMVFALAAKFSGLHRRIALRLLVTLGVSPGKLTFGVLVLSLLLALATTNAGAALLMTHIVFSIIDELKTGNRVSSSGADNIGVSMVSIESFPEETLKNGVDNPAFLDEEDACSREGRSTESLATEDSEEEEDLGDLKRTLLLAVLYGSNLGSVLLPFGTAPSHIFFRHLRGNETGGIQTDLHYGSWLAFVTPPVLIAFIAVSFTLIGSLTFWRSSKGEWDLRKGCPNGVEHYIRESGRSLGPITAHEGLILILGILCSLLWFFKEPRFLIGWEHLFNGAEVGHSTSGLLLVFLLFVLPRGFSENEEGSLQPLLEWKYVEGNLPWGVVLLVGGGFALADAAQHSGLSEWVAAQFIPMHTLHPASALIITLSIILFFSEVTSSTVAGGVFLPSLVQMSKKVGAHPFLLSLPATIDCSIGGFASPVATPASSILIEARGGLRPVDLIRGGLLMDILLLVVLYLDSLFLGEHLFAYSRSLL